MSKSNTKIGDVFSVKIDENNKKYFQLIAYDITQLNSDVIRAFEAKYPVETNPDLNEIISNKIEFYAHCVTKLGLKMGLWEKCGNSPRIGELEHILFRGSSDSGSKDGEQVQISSKWYTWKIGDENFKRVGILEGENRKAELGIIVNPYDIVDKVKTGKYNFFYPGFE